MRVRAVLREAWRNIVSGTARTLLLAMVLGSSSLVLLGADIVTVRAIDEAAAAFQAVGGSTMTVVAAGRVDGARCEALGQVPGVRAAGAIALPPEHVATTSLPGAPLPVGYVSRGFASVVHADSDTGPGVVLSDDAARTLGRRTGDTLETTAGATRIAGVYPYPVDGRRAGMGYMVLVPAGAGQVFDECWVDAWPQNAQLNSLLLTTLRPPGEGTGDDPVVGQLNGSLGAIFDGHAQFEHRITRFAGGAAGGVGLGIGCVAIRRRRVEFAAALHDQVRKVDVWAIALTETASWIAPVFVVAMAASMLLFGASGEVRVGALLGARVAVPAGLGALLGTVLGLGATRERHLFAYSKDR